MRIITKIKDLQHELSLLKNNGKQIGFVPTMGYLHEGHQRLLTEARSNNDIVVLSIFVNPLQFGVNEDLDKYPRDMDRDEKIAEEHGVDFIFYPTVQEMYQDDMSVAVKVVRGTNVLCGKSRPGHFDGVATVLTKLFNIVQPSKAYFGLKDAQQVAIVEGLVNDLNFSIEIVRVETVREEDGLAKSSRNVFLLAEERREAKELYASLQIARDMIEIGIRDPEQIQARMKEHIQSKTSGKIDYIEILSYPTLEKIEKLEGQFIIAIAVRFTAARLIDNTVITLK